MEPSPKTQRQTARFSLRLKMLSALLLIAGFGLSLHLALLAESAGTEQFSGLSNIKALPKIQLGPASKPHPIPRQMFTKNLPAISPKPQLEPTLEQTHTEAPQAAGKAPEQSAAQPPMTTEEETLQPENETPPTETTQADEPVENSSQPATLPIPLAAGDTIDLQDSVMGLLVKNGSILSDGSISLPLIGRVTLAGQTMAQARQALNEKYRHYFTDPQLSLRIARRHPVRVYLTGAVANPGVYISGKDTRPEALKNQATLGEFNQQFRFYRLYLADALIMAGGLNYNANVQDVLIHRRYPEHKTLHINVLALFQGGNTMQDIALQDQDVIEVPALSENTLVLDGAAQEFGRSNLNNDEFKISVIGAVNKPGGYPVHRSDTVLSAIARAGGFSDTANPSRVYILHATDYGQLTHREINLQDKKLIGKKPIHEFTALLPNDVVFVDESAGKKMALYGRNLFLDRIAVAAMFPFFNKFFNKN